MKKIIYVKPSFKQQPSDKVLFVAPTFVELECEDENKYFGYVLKLSSQEVYSEKLEICLNNRKSEYAKLNQDEMRYDDEVNGTTIWIDTIKEIKKRFPKPLMR